MAQKYYKKFSATGVANSLEMDSGGLESTAAEPKVLKAILVHVTGQIGNDVEVWLDRERLVEVPDWMFNTQMGLAGNVHPFSSTRLLRLPLDIPIPIGQKIYAGIHCAGSNYNISGAYEYEIGRA